jgi:ubiquinone/menaquinone biosynthesis C-methylase UbiE
MNEKHPETLIQKNYYSHTAHLYDDMHVQYGDEHYFALCWMSSLINMYSIKSILDIGSGTGRAISFLRQWHPNISIVGLEPVAELREQGHKRGIPLDQLIDGDAMALDFSDNEFEMVCEFGALHHIPDPSKAVSEMLRVGQRAIFVSDSNNFGQGPLAFRAIKQILNKIKLWKAYNYFATKGKGYYLSEGDGLFYSYSIFNDYDLIKNSCKSVHMLNTKNSGQNLYKTASHLALFGLK